MSDTLGTWLQSDGMVIASATGLGYLVAFSYEVGGAAAHGYPVSLVQVGVQNIVIATIAVVSLLLFLQVVFSLIPIKLLAMPGPVMQELLPAAPIFAFLLLVAIAVRDYWLTILWFSFLFTIPLLMNLTVPLLTERRTKGYGAKLQAARERVAEFPTLGDRLVDRFSTPTFLIGLALMLVLLAGAAGFGSAKRTETFYVIGSEPEQVVLRIVGERIITTELHRDSLVIGPTYLIVPLGSENATAMTRQHLGRLRLAPTTPRAR